jgi:hypothetical protein
MSGAAHTPGPWEIDGRVAGYVYCRDRRGAVVACALSNGPRAQAELDANGRLIAAAPELLAALKRALGDMRTLLREGGGAPEEIERDDRVASLRAALAKAEGAPPLPTAP